MTTKNIFLACSKIGKYERKTLDGREYLVCPVTMMKEGVWRANEGPVLYRKEELKLYHEAWNNKPILDGHPQDEDGNFTNAATADVLEKQKLGFLLNSAFEGDSLKAEAWLDEELVKAKKPELVDALEAGDPIEVSCGLIANCEITRGKFKNRTYNMVAVEHRPDHLAVLIGKKGACSVADGAGLLVMQSFENDDIPEDLRNSAIDRLDMLLANQLSHSRIRELVGKALSELAAQERQDNPDRYVSFWIEDIVGKVAIVYWNGSYVEIPFRASGSGLKLTGSPPYREVERVVQYRLVDGTVIGNESTDIPKEEGTSVKKSEMISLLIANGGYDEADKPMLEGMTEEKLTKLTSAIQKPNGTTLANQTPAAPTPVQFDYKAFMAQAPPEFQRHVARSMKLANQQVTDAIAKIVTLANGAYTEEELKAMDPDAVLKLQTVLANQKPAVPAETEDLFADTDWSGSGGFFDVGRVRQGTTLANEGDDDAPLGSTPSTFVAKK